MVSVGTFALVGAFSTGIVVQAVIATPTIVVANRLGLASAAKVRPETFRVLVIALLALAGASSVASAFGG
jgi:uncharacterized membrane protein YfcA